LTWEVFLPDRVEVRQLRGNAFAMSLFPGRVADSFVADGETSNEEFSIVRNEPAIELGTLAPGQVGGVVVDPMGAAVGGAKVTVTSTDKGVSRTATTDQEGRWVIPSLNSGPVRVLVESPGFKSSAVEMNFDASHASRLGTTLQVGTVAE